MKPRLAFEYRRATSAVALGLALAGAAPAARAQSTTLGATDFNIAVAGFDAAGKVVPLSSDTLASYFTAARCACPTNVVLGVSIASDSVSKVTSSDALEVTFMAGPACDDPSVSGCATLGSSLSLDMSTTSNSETVSS